MKSGEILSIEQSSNLFVRLKFHKYSEMKFSSRTMPPQAGAGVNTPPLPRALKLLSGGAEAIMKEFI